jgi:uncharacterized glyoxalase superfamily protein PhnB
MGGGLQTSNAVPILRSFSEKEAHDFYLRFLGFDIVFEHRFAPGAPLYLEIRRGGCTLHLSEHHGDASPGAAVRIEVSDVQAFLSEIRDRGHARLNPDIETMSWGEVQVSLPDPFGNRLIFYTRLPE